MHSLHHTEETRSASMSRHAGRLRRRDGPRPRALHAPPPAPADGLQLVDKCHEGAPSAYAVNLKLLAAKDLIAANLNGTSDPYALITCGQDKRFSSMVPGSRNPMWGEEFNFAVDCLPVKIKVELYDWDIVWRSTTLGSVTVSVESEKQSGPVWYTLDGSSGRVCLHIKAIRVNESSSGALNNSAEADARKKISLDKEGPTVVHQKPGHLQTIFGLPPDEVVEHSYSCALERSFLYHGRIYVSLWHICFYSNIFSKQIKAGGGLKGEMKRFLRHGAMSMWCASIWIVMYVSMRLLTSLLISVRLGRRLMSGHGCRLHFKQRARLGRLGRRPESSDVRSSKP